MQLVKFLDQEENLIFRIEPETREELAFMRFVIFEKRDEFPVEVDAVEGPVLEGKFTNPQKPVPTVNDSVTVLDLIEATENESIEEFTSNQEPVQALVEMLDLVKKCSQEWKKPIWRKSPWPQCVWYMKKTVSISELVNENSEKLL